ncbi:MAG: hypothetical protein R3200_13195 [Xanthomonadales bacterium]|nr:hypothetical protein [Xanthomonadales bacterium]
MQKILVRNFLLASVLLLGGCAGEVIVRDTFPTPVVEPVPYRVGVYYSPRFQGYVYDNEENGVSFELGSKQTALYRTVFEAMFLQTIPVNSTEGSASYGDLDLILEPVLEEYAFLAPSETATDFFAVSLKYQIRLYSGSGDLIGYWPFVAYGKNRTKLVNKNESLGDATSRALRDAAAALVSQFRTVVITEQWKLPEEASG